MRCIRVLVVDDSAVARALLLAILSTDIEIQVVGEARNDQEALKMVRALNPDLVTMDVEMPVMDGLEAIEQIMVSNPVPILVVTARENIQTAYTAISKGALECIEKPNISLESSKEFVDKIKLLSTVKVIRHLSQRLRLHTRTGTQTPDETRRGFETVIAIAVSTGGPKALSTLLPELPEDFPCPVVIAQHLSDGFIRGLVDWLNGLTKLRVEEGIEHETLAAGTVYISPPEKHMEITTLDKISFVERRLHDIYHPSCDILLSSIAHVYCDHSVGVILTGMGIDGIYGMGKIQKAGGITIAQDDKSSLIFGMPKVAIEKGYIDKILPLNEISSELMRIASNGKR